MANKRNRQKVQENRASRREKLAKKEVQADKFQEERKQSVIPLIAKNENQKLGLQHLAEKQLVILLGSAGCGKTELACWWASKQWKENAVNNIILTRPNKSLGADAGSIPGNDFQKLLPFTMSMLQKFKKYLGTGILRNNLRTEDIDVLFNDTSGIQVVSVEKIQGLSFPESTIVIADEIQSATISQVKALVTRMEEGAQIVICGDITQSALSGKSGLEYLVEKTMENPHVGVGIVQFTPDDCCRYGISKHYTEVFEKDGNRW